MPWAVAGAAITAGAGLIGSSMQSSAASKGQEAALAAQQESEAQAREDLSPWRGAGQNALMQTSALSGAEGPEAAQTAMGDFFTSPGYQWRMDEGMRAVDAGAAARGMLRSGATLKAEQTFAQGLASSEFDNYYNRLFNLSKLGEDAAARSASASMDAGRINSATEIGGANAQSSIYGNLSNSLGGAAGGLLQNKNFQNWLSPANTGWDASAHAPPRTATPAAGGGYNW